MSHERILRRLVIKAFHVKEVEISDKFGFSNGVLSIDKQITNEIFESEETIENIEISIIEPRERELYVNSIMDVIPVSTKVLGVLGEGITHTMTGMYIVLTGAKKDGSQMAEFGSSEGILSEQMVFDRAGTPGKNDVLILFNVTLKDEYIFDRNLPLSCHRACDVFAQKIREVIKSMDGRDADEVHEFYDKVRENCKKVVILKQIAGQGAMYDNQLFPSEPSGYFGGKSIIDMGNVPMIISPNEYRDGAIRAMT